jgi:predicted MFS family arabinose efflux permease
MQPSNDVAPKYTFTNYQKFIIGLTAFLQFTIILDFMVLSPLGAQLMLEMHLQPSEFGWVVSVYAFAAGISGILAAGFADKFDRKKLLLFFYFGFLFGTFLCAVAPDFQSLLVARIVAGMFGGVVGAVGMAIVSDLFPLEVRGRVLGFGQMAFAAAQVLGLPIGLLLANKFNWHAPFWMISGVGLLVGVIIFWKMKPVADHLLIKNDRNAFQHLIKTLTNPSYLRAFLATILLATGGFMLMPFGSAFSTGNLGLSMSSLPILYGITGICSMIIGPFTGKANDKFGRINLFLAGTVVAIIVTTIYTRLGITPFWLICTMSILMWVGISARMISSSVLFSGIPSNQDRGAFTSIQSAISSVSGGIAASIAGMIVVRGSDGLLKNYDWLGNVVVLSMILAAILIFRLNNQLKKGV